MKKFTAAFFILISFVNLSYSQNQDSSNTYKLKEIIVSGKKVTIDQSEFPVEKENLADVLKAGGVEIIRKGVFLAQDIYADGLKRGDYTITVDGERYHNACPMRMDAPVTRINPVEVKSVEIVKSSSNLQSGLGGAIEINRSLPAENLGISGTLTQIAGKSKETDFSLMAEKLHQRISLRYVRGLPYKTGNNKSFKDLYGYRDNKEFRFGEGSFYGISGNFKYTGSIMYSENVSFPYLQMDEIKSVVYNSSVSLREYKIYFNYTSHLMNNSLRVSSMAMETDAKNLTAGFVSDFFEAYYRHWDADNHIDMPTGMSIKNHLLPEINMYSANIFKKTDFAGINLSGKAGITYYNLGDKSAVDFYKRIHPGAEGNRIFPTGGISVSKTGLLANSLSMSAMIDFAAEAPEAEALFVNVKRMTGKPYWSGNPELKQPLRTTLRTNLSIPYAGIDLFGSYIFNYVYLASSSNGTQKYQTFGNVNAMILGVNFRIKYGLFESVTTYTYGENRSNNNPLMEIEPLHISNRLNSPKIFNMKFYIRHTYENAQKRIDESFNEFAGSAWNKIDLGMSYGLSNILIGLDAENILNHNILKHLSYVRDPFASGMKVIEPGVSYRLNVRYNY